MPCQPPPVPDAPVMDEDFHLGMALWNADQYVEAHEAFERLWMVEVGPRRHFLRGLVHAAMGFHYVTRQDTVSARSKLSSAAGLLDGFPGDFLGLDVDGLRAGLTSLLAELEAGRDPMALEAGGRAIPGLHFQSAGASLPEAKP